AFTRCAAVMVETEYCHQEHLLGERKLVAAEEVGAHMRRQDGEVAARTGASFDPAHRGDGAIQAHKNCLNYSPDFSWA
ncbi:MAG: hypothetical protein WA172_05790, partial [Terriglobales bacterium]